MSSSKGKKEKTKQKKNGRDICVTFINYFTCVKLDGYAGHPFSYEFTNGKSFFHFLKCVVSLFRLFLALKTCIEGYVLFNLHL